MFIIEINYNFDWKKIPQVPIYTASTCPFAEQVYSMKLLRLRSPKPN